MKNIDYEKYKKLKWYQKPFFATVKHFGNIDEAYKAKPRKWVYNLIYTIIVLIVLIWFALDIDMFDAFKAPNWTKLGNMLNGFLHPNFEYMFGTSELFNFKNSVVYQIIETFAIAFIGTIIASLLSIPFGFLASRKITGKYSIISEILLITIRTFPELLLGYIFIQVFGFGPVTGVAVLSLHSIGMIGKMYAEQIDLINDEPIEALDAVGATRLVKIQRGVLPQVVPNFLSTVLYRFDLNIRTASLLGLVGAGGVGYPISVYATNEYWSELAAVLYGVIFLVILVDICSSFIRKKLI